MLLYFRTVMHYLTTVRLIIIDKDTRYLYFSLKRFVFVPSRTQNHLNIVAYKQNILHRNASKTPKTIVMK